MPFIDELFVHIRDIFVETGTFQGDTIYKVANNDACKPDKIISLELSDVFFNRCVNRFSDNPNILLHKANSKYDLYSIIKNIDSPMTFWLDSHWSGTPDVGCDPITVCPILEELAQIKQHANNAHTIMIDDIRLMNSSVDKYNGFPVTMEQIIALIYSINPNYTLKYYDDYTGKNDILVAYIQEKLCIHKYLTVCKSNPQPPGFADFLRGTIALYNFSQKYGYKLLLDNSHPIYKYFAKNDNLILSNSSADVYELLPGLSYETIYTMLDHIFSINKPFTVMTNSFYNVNNYVPSNWGSISDDCSAYLRTTFSPTIELNNRIEYVMRSVHCMPTEQPFKVIHIRFGDKFIHNNVYDDDLYNKYYAKISEIINADTTVNYILMSDSTTISQKLKNNLHTLYYWDNEKVHIGDLLNNADNAILDTLTDFFIMSKSNEIISNGSGFSNAVSVIYNIKYTII